MFQSVCSDRIQENSENYNLCTKKAKYKVNIYIMPVGMRSYQGRSLMIYIKDVSLVIHSRYFPFSSENLLEEGQTDALKGHIS